MASLQLHHPLPLGFRDNAGEEFDAPFARLDRFGGRFAVMWYRHTGRWWCLRTDLPPDRFDPEALREQAGDATFARGAAYHRDGQVAILSLDVSRVLAVVSGSRTVVTGRGFGIGGECSCPTSAAAAEQAAYVADLKVRFARKRSFMKLLP